MTEIDIKLERTGFPVKIGGHEFFYSTSSESAKRYVELEATVNERIKELQKSIVDTAIIDGQTVDVDSFGKAIDYAKEGVKLNYDLLLGEGTFDTLYADFPDVEALSRALIEVRANIELKLEEIEAKRMAVNKAKVDELKAQLDAKK
jgi:phage protein